MACRLSHLEPGGLISDFLVRHVISQFPFRAVGWRTLRPGGLTRLFEVVVGEKIKLRSYLNRLVANPQRFDAELFREVYAS